MLSFRCREFIDLLRLPATLSTVLERKLQSNTVGLEDAFKVVTVDDIERMVTEKDLTAFEDLSVIPNALLTTRSKLYSQLHTKNVKELFVTAFHLSESIEYDDLFEEFWNWCSACECGVECLADNLDELEWQLWDPQLLRIPHADSPNVIVRGLPTVISETLNFSIFKHGAAVLCPISDIKAGSILKRDFLPKKRTRDRIARLLTLIGDQPERWAHSTELEGLKKIESSCTTVAKANLENAKPIAEKAESRPLAAMTEFTPEIRKASNLPVFTDYPGIVENLNHPSFEVVENFPESNILFAVSPVDNFNTLGQRYVNQFPSETQLLSPQSVLLLVERKCRDSSMEQTIFPDWFPVSFDLTAEIKWFLEANADQVDELWLLLSGEAGSFDWCLTSKSRTVMKYLEANDGNWIAQKSMSDPMLVTGKRLRISLFLLVRSFQPLQTFLYKKASGRLAAQDYSTTAELLADASVHLPFEDFHAEALSHNQLVEALEGEGLKWDELFRQLTEIISDLLRLVHEDIGPSQRSRALYRLDFALPAFRSGEKFQPQFLAAAFAPHLDIPLSENPDFVNQIFEVLFVKKSQSDQFVKIGDEIISDIESCSDSESI